MLGSIVSRLASPTAHWRKILGEKKLEVKIFMKHPEMHQKWKWEKLLKIAQAAQKSRFGGSGGGVLPRMDGQLDRQTTNIAEWEV